MDKETFVFKFENEDTVITEVQIDNAVERATEVIVESLGVFYKALLVEVEGRRLEVVGEIKEVTPVEVTTTEYQEVLTLKGTKQELIDRLQGALTHEVQHLYSDVSEPYRGAIQEYEQVSDEDIKYIAQEVISDLFYEEGDA